MTAEDKKEALKYLIYLVGDVYQPMHVSRKADKGGNTIQVGFYNKGTNLRSLWDSKQIDHEGFSKQELIKSYDVATPVQSSNGKPTAQWSGFGKVTKPAVKFIHSASQGKRSIRCLTTNTSLSSAGESAKRESVWQVSSTSYSTIKL